MSNAQMLVRKTVGAGTMNSYGDRFLVGNHVIVIDSLTMKEVFNKELSCKITSVCADFIILTSDSMKSGSKVSEKYDIGKPGNGGDNASKRLNGLARAVVESLGHTQKPEDTTGKAFEKLVGDTLIKMLEIDPATDLTRTSGRKFTGRGITLKVFSKTNTARDGKYAGKEFVNNDFTALAQLPEQIKAKRAMIEAPPAPTETPVQKATAAVAAKMAAKPAPQPAPETEVGGDDEHQANAGDSGADDMLAGLE